MRLGVDLPSLKGTDLRTPDFEEFRGNVGEFLQQVDPAEVIGKLTLDLVQETDYHPNGFWIVRLTDPARKDEDGQVRIHLWPNAAADCDPDVHRHPWHLGSLVMVEDYAEQIADVTAIDDPAAANYFSYRQEHDAARGVDMQVDPLPLDVQLSDLETYPVGSVHFMSEDQYHVTPPGPTDRLAITMPVMGSALTINRRRLISADRPVTEVQHPYPKVEKPAALEVWRKIEIAQRALRNQ